MHNQIVGASFVMFIGNPLHGTKDERSAGRVVGLEITASHVQLCHFSSSKTDRIVIGA